MVIRIWLKYHCVSFFELFTFNECEWLRIFNVPKMNCVHKWDFLDFDTFCHLKNNHSFHNPGEPYIYPEQTDWDFLDVG